MLAAHINTEDQEMVYKEREFFGIPEEVTVKPEAQLEADVAAALAASGKLDATDVAVTVVSDAIIILSGWVADEEEIQRCVEVAGSVPGVQRVRSQILVRDNTSPNDRKR